MAELGTIYRITNIINSKVYIGQTIMGIKLRFQDHISSFRRGRANCYKLYRAFAKYGIENFKIETIEECPKDRLNEREKYWINFYNSTKTGYNVSIGGNVTRTSKLIDEDKVLELFNNGITAVKIAKILHVNNYKVSDVLKKHGVIYGKDKQKTSQEILSKIPNLYLEGYGSYKIAKILNIDKGVVLRYLRKHNLIRTFNETIKVRNTYLSK